MYINILVFNFQGARAACITVANITGPFSGKVRYTQFPLHLLPVADSIEQRRRSSQEDEDVVRRDSGGGHVQVVGDHYDLDDVDSVSRQTDWRKKRSLILLSN